MLMFKLWNWSSASRTRDYWHGQMSFLPLDQHVSLRASVRKENAECDQPDHSRGYIGSSQWKRQVAWLLAKPSRQVDDYRPSRWIFNNLNEQRAMGAHSLCEVDRDTTRKKILTKKDKFLRFCVDRLFFSYSLSPTCWIIPVAPTKTTGSLNRRIYACIRKVFWNSKCGICKFHKTDCNWK